MKQEELFKKYGIVEETKWCMDSEDFNKLVRDHFPALTNQERFKEFECVAEFEWNNYSNYDAEIANKNEFLEESKDSLYNKYDRKDIMSGKFGVSLDAIFTFLIEHNILPCGKYEIQVSW